MQHHHPVPLKSPKEKMHEMQGALARVGSYRVKKVRNKTNLKPPEIKFLPILKHRSHIGGHLEHNIQERLQ